MRFEDVKMDYNEMLNGVTGRVNYGDYELSIVKHAHSYGGNRGLYEIAVYKGDNQIELPGITETNDTVKGWLTEQEVDGIMIKMYTISGKNPK